MEKKICRDCGKELPLNQFSKHSRYKDGLLPRCKECEKKCKKLSHEGTVTQQGVKATFKISDFDDNMLFAELRRRGYAGELRYNRVVSI